MRRGIHALLILIFVFILTVAPVGFDVAHAQSFWDLFRGWDSFVATIGTWTLGLFHIAVELTAWLLNGSITLGVAQMSNFVNELEAIDFTWRTFRDIANISFIFIILWAAFQTMLQAGSFQTKQVVTRLVIIALLVNFSLFLTKAVIDISNILALQFYNGMQITSTDDDVGLADVFLESLQLKTIYNTDSRSGQLEGVDVLKPENVGTITIVGSIFFLITSFIFLAAAILFMIRFGVLILLMIVAPLAFAAVILPNTKKYFNKWIGMLLAQSFFAPAYLALTYVAVRIMTDPTFKSTLYTGSLSENILGLGGPINVILAFGIVTIFLVASLVMAASMGAAGSQTMMSWGKTAKNWGMNKVKGGASRVAMVPVRTAQAVGRDARSTYRQVRGHLANMALKSDSKWGTVGRAAMGGTARVDRLARAGQDEIKEAKKSYNEMSTLALQRILNSPLMTGNRRDKAAITEILANREKGLDPQRVDVETIRTAKKTIERKGGETKDIDKSLWQFARTEDERVKAIAGNKDEKIKPISPENVEKLDEDDYFKNAGVPIFKAMFQTFSKQHINNLINRDGEASEIFFDKLKDVLIESGHAPQQGAVAGSIEHLAQWLADNTSNGGMNNRNLASWVRSREGQDYLQSTNLFINQPLPQPQNQQQNPANPQPAPGRGGVQYRSPRSRRP